MEIDGLKDDIAVYLDEQREMLVKLADRIFANPEIGFSEEKASGWLSAILAESGFQVERNVGGLPTAFRAVWGSQRPTVAFLCEYDALPEIGHACGHNLIAAASLGAGLALSRVLPAEKGSVWVVGTPGEENGGGKAVLVEEGLFDEVDAAMMFHPGPANVLMSTTTALDAYEFVFHGKSAHAAASPQEGINALDGLLMLFNGINALRQHLRDDARVHGIIAEGGQAPNVIPDKAV